MREANEYWTERRFVGGNRLCKTENEIRFVLNNNNIDDDDDDDDNNNNNNIGRSNHTG
jgi:hypothetical protein